VKPFAYQRAADVRSAVAAVATDDHARFLGAGTNLVDNLKLGVTEAALLVDVSRLPLDQVDETEEGGLRIGAAVRNSDLAAHPTVRATYPVLSEALLSGASGQLRNLATTAGNLLQRTRCAYFRDPSTPCNKREPGSGCSAREGYTRYHAIVGASPQCVAVHPSDLAVAMSALDAVVRLIGPDGERDIPATGLHRLPGAQPERDTVLERAELITEVRLPPLAPGTVSAYRKVRDRASYAFALVSVAAVLRIEDGVIRDARIAFGGVAHKPWLAVRAEAALIGAAATAETFTSAAQEEFSDAEPLRDNAFKVPLARRTLVSVLRDLAGREPR
jgi:xanthine dehydrogenase YagS FAD-binding subunit